MKLFTTLAGAVLAASFVTSAMAAECSRPTAPSVVDGKSASQEQMGETHQAVKAYIASTDAFLSCIKTGADEEKAAVTNDKSLDDKARKTKLNGIEQSLATRHNAAVEDMEGVAAKFNTAIREYKAAQASAK
ncbi:hypothetical protein [Govanella unica]|uniref:Uncharacterized protein n=1 Tax=Govanella unica TaxID=2975056 RepID=A0A9X3U014_9PROT|nr:hypothetical protein [Govania unica]MDA5194936.1 hypothetical protein [Govania unica]